MPHSRRFVMVLFLLASAQTAAYAQGPVAAAQLSQPDVPGFSPLDYQIGARGVLDGSLSTGTGLRFEWQIEQGPRGSRQGEVIDCRVPICNLAPLFFRGHDVGDWILRLTVTDQAGLTAQTRVALRVEGFAPEEKRSSRGNGLDESDVVQAINRHGDPPCGNKRRNENPRDCTTPIVEAPIACIGYDDYNFHGLLGGQIRPGFGYWRTNECDDVLPNGNYEPYYQHRDPPFDVVLNELRRLAAGEGIAVTITDGWDQDGGHAVASRHYEGRAIDLDWTAAREVRLGGVIDVGLGRLAYLTEKALRNVAAGAAWWIQNETSLSHVHFSMDGTNAFDWGARCGDQAGRTCLTSLAQASPASSGGAVGEMITGWGRTQGWPQAALFQEAGSPAGGIKCDSLAGLLTKYDSVANWQCWNLPNLDEALHALAYSAAWWRREQGTALTAAIPLGSHQRWVAVEGVVTRPPESSPSRDADPTRSEATPTSPMLGAYRVEGLFIDDPEGFKGKRFVARNELQSLFPATEGAWRVLLPAFAWKSSQNLQAGPMSAGVSAASEVRIVHPLDYNATRTWFEVGLPLPIEVLAPSGTTWMQAEVVGGGIITEKQETPWTLVWTPRDFGLVDVRVLAQTPKGFQEARVTVQVRDTLKPSVTFDPELPLEIHGRTQVRVFAEDNDRVTGVQLLIGGADSLNVTMTPCSGRPRCWEYEWNPRVTGRYGLTAFAHDPNANLGQAVLDVNVLQVGTGGITGSLEVLNSSVRPSRVTLYIDANDNRVFDTGELSDATASDGTYWIRRVPAGTHHLRVYSEQYDVFQPPDGERIIALGFDELRQGIGFLLAGAGRIAGSVRDASAAPLSGLAVYIDRDSSGTFTFGDPSATTAADGSYEFTRLLAGSHAVRVVTNEASVVLSPPNEFHAVTLATNREKRNGIDFTVGEPQGRIEGSVRAEDGSPQFDVEVYIDLNGNSLPDGNDPITSTGRSGAFAFESLRKGVYRVGANAERLAVLQPPGGFHSVTLDNHSDHETIMFTVGLGRIEGTVRAQTGRSLGGVTVYVDQQPPFGAYQVGEPAGATDGNGAYSIRGVAFGAQTVRIVLSADLIRVTAPPAGAHTLTLDVNQPIRTGVDFTVECRSCLHITGRVLADTGAGVPAAVLYLDANGNRQLDGGETAARTDATGSYDFSGLTGGSRHDVAIVLPPGFNQLIDPIVGFRTVVLPAGADATGVDFVISGPPATPPGATRVSQDLIRQTVAYAEGDDTEFRTSIPVKDWVCSVTGFAIENEVFSPLNRTLLAKRALPGSDGFWRTKATVAHNPYEANGPGRRTVDLLCVSRQIASLQSRSKPFFRESFGFPNTHLGSGVFSLGIDSNRYACEIAGFSVAPRRFIFNAGLDTDGAHDLWFDLERQGSTWHLRKNASVIGVQVPSDTFDIAVDVLCAERSITDDTITFAGTGPFTVPRIDPQRLYFTSAVNGAGDTPDVSFEGLDDWECGLGGFRFDHGDLNEHGDRALLMTHRALYDGDRWHLSADVRSHHQNESWTLPFYCIRRNGPPSSAPVMTLARPERFQDPWGHGIHLEWTPTSLPGATYYEIQTATRPNPPNWRWTPHGNGRLVSWGGWANHHGVIPCETARECLPNGREYFYRIRVLDGQKQPLSDWSNVISARVTDYLGFAYLVGDWDGDGKDNLAIRRGGRILMDTNFDGNPDREQAFGNGDAEDQYLVGDWDGDGKDNLAVRRGNCVHMDFNFDATADRVQCYGNGAPEDGYLVGDWDGDGKDNLAVRRWDHVLMDYDFDGPADRDQAYGNGGAEDQYHVGDWDGDGKDNLAVRRGATLLMDYNFDAVPDREQGYGLGLDEAEYLVGDWDGDGKDNLAVRRAHCVLMDFDFDGSHDREQCFGDSRLFAPRLRLGPPVPPGPYVEPTEVTLEVAEWAGDGLQLSWSFETKGAAFQVVSGCAAGTAGGPGVNRCVVRIWRVSTTSTSAGGTTSPTSRVTVSAAAPEDQVVVTVTGRDRYGATVFSRVELTLRTGTPCNPDCRE